MGLTRSPNSPLNDPRECKINKMSGNNSCVSCKDIILNNNFVTCNSCSNVYDQKCVFINDCQARYFKNKNAAWYCPSCYFNQLSENSTAIKKFDEQLTVLNNDLASCMSIVNNMKLTVGSIHQELNQRCAETESKVEGFQSRMDNIEKILSSNCLEVSGLHPKAFEAKNSLSVFLSQLFVEFGFSPSIDFEPKWNYVTKVVSLFFLDQGLVSSIYNKYCEIVTSSNSETNGIFTADYCSLKIQPCTITITFTNQHSSLQKRLDVLEYERYSKDIKMRGLPYILNETGDSLVETFRKIILYLNCEGSLNDFTIRRIRNTDTCIVTFPNSSLRDKAFYAYVNLMVKIRSGGIDPKLVGLTSSERIVFSDNLTDTTRILYGLSKKLKQKGTISNFSTRRGKVVIMLKGRDKWIAVGSTDELFSLISS